MQVITDVVSSSAQTSSEKNNASDEISITDLIAEGAKAKFDEPICSFYAHLIPFKLQTTA